MVGQGPHWSAGGGDDIGLVGLAHDVLLPGVADLGAEISRAETAGQSEG